jgi:hypothetical protein
MAEAQWYAEEYQLTLDQALYRMHQMELISSLNHQLLTEEGESFGGLWLIHEPELRLHIAFTENGEATAKHYINPDMHKDLRKIAVIEYAPISYQELLREHKAADSMLKSIGVDHDILLDVTTSSNILLVLDSDELYATMKSTANELPSSVRVVEVDQLSAPEADLYGGLSTTPCTAGPSIWIGASSTYGISSANHCGVVTYGGVALGRPIRSPTLDLAGCRDGGHRTRNRIKTGPNTRIVVSSSRTRSALWVGAPVHKYGKCSGYTSGTITFTVVNTFFVGSNANSCAGDSGGPWFWAYYAYGGHVGQGYGIHLFTPIDNYRTLGLTIQIWDR